MSELPQPDYARNMRIVSHSDQGRRPDGGLYILGYGGRVLALRQPALALVTSASETSKFA
jgi:hypothetical protein